MPGAYITSFIQTGVLYAWKWIDSEGDYILGWVADRANTQYRQDYYVDRSASTRRLRWQYYEWILDEAEMTRTLTATGRWDAIDLVEGAYYYSEYAGPDDRAVTSVDKLPGGWWISNRYGKPFDLNDLLAGS